MSDERAAADESDLKQCGRCAAWIPRSATSCSYCGTTSPDSRIDPRPSRSPLGLPPWITATRVIVAMNVLFFAFGSWAQFARWSATPPGPWLLWGQSIGGREFGLEAPGAYLHRSVVAGEWWRVLAHLYLHAGVVHLVFNMLALWRLGEFAEELFGAARFIAVYCLTGVFTALFAVFWAVRVGGIPAGHDGTGASGAVFGVGGLLAAYLVRRGTARGRRMGWAIVQSLALAFALSFFVPMMMGHAGHAAGLLLGAILGLVLTDRFSTRVSPESRRNWWLLSALASVLTLVSLGLGISHTLNQLGARR